MIESNQPLCCAGCGAVNPAVANYCRQCGVALSERLVQPATVMTSLMKQWRALTLLMTRKDVRKFLGEPATIRLPDGAEGAKEEQWFYHYDVVGPCESVEGGQIGSHRRRITATVTFHAPDGRILRWVEPDWTLLS